MKKQTIAELAEEYRQRDREYSFSMFLCHRERKGAVKAYDSKELYNAIIRARS